MGSDMAMEKIVTHTYGRWEMDGADQLFNIYRKSSYDNSERLIWSGTEKKVSLSSDLIKLLIGNIPERPEPVLPKRDRIWMVLRTYYDYCDTEVLDAVMEIVEEDNAKE